MMCKCGVVLSISVVIVSSLILLVTSFNVDTVNYVQHKGPEQSMFGFSVANHIEHESSWVLVGAPTSQGARSRIQRGGAVFKCRTNSDNACEEVDFHQEKSGTSDDKNNQWFGATISSAGRNKPVVACAPRYVWFTETTEERRDPVGTCYIAKDNFRKFSEYSPCRTSYYGYHRQGSCQAGFSAGISTDGKRLFVGAPGSWYWQGQMYSIDPMINFPFSPGFVGAPYGFGFGKKGQVHQQSLDDRPAVMSTPEGPASEDNSYEGYSMVVGDFNHARVEGIAVGMPKGGDMLEGKVLLYTWNLTNYLNITGKQMGSYFGYALAASDVDGDGRTDLIIGAPMHVEPNTQLKYEVGRVHVLYQGRSGDYAVEVVLDGFKSKSRFGLSLSTLGDMNYDGYGDFAVGAPYDGPNEHGAVYIFQGSSNGVIKQYSQVIYAEDMQGSYGSAYPLTTFGFSITGGIDMDGNDYPDMAVGAYLSDTAYFFRARPVVRVEAYVRFDEPKVIHLDRKTCSKPGNPGVQVPCTHIQVCLRYTGVGAPPRIDLNLQYILDAQKPSYSRIYSSRGSGKEVNGTITLYIDSALNCDRSLRDTIYLQESIADKLTDLEIQVKYSLRGSDYPAHYQRDPNGILLPIIDLSTPALVNDTIGIFKNCGSDNVCIPDLHLFVRKEVTKYLYDADNPIEFDIEITNTKDDSYNTQFYIHLPQDIEFRGAPIIDNSESESKLPCSPLPSNASIFSCDIGNPLVKNTGVHFKVRVAPKRGQAILKPTYVFFMNVTSANPENNFTMEDNAITISIDIWVDAILGIEGKSTPSTIHYKASEYNSAAVAKWDVELGPPVIHSYTVVNKGPSDVHEVELYIIWPSSTLAGEDLLYLVEPPHTEGVKCEKIDTNVRGLLLTVQQDVWVQTGIHKGAGGGGTAEPHIETNPAVPGNTSNTITRTITVLTFYDVNSQPIHVMEVIGEVGGEAYWKNVSIAASQFKGPLTVQGNSSSLIIKYSEGGKETYSIVSRKPAPPEVPYSSYYINSNVSTLVSYYSHVGALVEQEYTIEQPGSQSFKDRIESTKQRLRQPLRILTNTTWHFDYTSPDGRMHAHYIISQSGTETGTDGEISSTTIRTIVKFYNSRGIQLSEEVSIEGKPGTEAYWELINKKISGFIEPVTMHITTYEVITYFRNGQQVREQKKPIAIAPEQASVTATTTTTTTIKVTSSSGAILFADDMPGEKGSKIYNDYFKDILHRIKEPVMIETKTVYTILYRSPNGLEVYRGVYIEIHREPYNPNIIESNRKETITTITFYDVHKRIVHQENITESVNSEEYWQKINEIMSRFGEQQISIHVDTKTVVIYYVNGVEVSSENVPGSNLPLQQEIIYRPQTDITTTITVFNAAGNILEQKIENGKMDVSINDIANRYREAITIEIKTVYVTTYYNSNGQMTHRGTVTKTETHTRSPPTSHETSEIRTVTTIIFYDYNRHIVYQENIADEIGSEKYWEKINELISRYQQQQITVHITTKRIIVYYLHGQETRTENIDGSEQEISYRPQTTITTRIIVYSSNGRILYDQTVPGRRGSINDIISKYNEPIRVEIHTIYTISYYNSNSQVTHTGIYTDIQTQHHRPTHPPIVPIPNTTQRETTITTIIFYDSHRNIIYQGEIREEPQSEAYWEQINKLIMQFQQYQQITMHITTRTIITYYVDGQPTDTKEIPNTSGPSDTSITTRIIATTTITVHNSNRQTLFEGTVNAEKGSAEYQNYLRQIIDRFRDTPITVVIRTTYTITYYGAGGRILKTGTKHTEETQTHNQHEASDSRTTIITTIQIFDSNRNMIHQEKISDEPNTPQYWEYIKKVIGDYTFPVNIYTNSSKVVTYYVNGVQTRVEYLPGNVIVPFRSHIDDVRTVISYQDANKKELDRETIHGELTAEEKQRRANDFSKRYRGSFTVEIETTKRISFRSFDGAILYSDSVGGPILPPTGNSKIITQTTFQVYGADRTLLYTRTIDGATGSPAYNTAIMDIISRFPESITIYTNSTKTITLYNNEGHTVNKQIVSEPRSTVQRQRDDQHADRAITTIAFYGPDGSTIHEDVIHGAPGQDLYSQLDKIAAEYGGVVKSYGGRVNEDGSIGGPITVVDSPYPGGNLHASNKHFTDFEVPHSQQHSQWNSGYNRTEARHGGGYAYGSDSSSHGINLNVNQGDIGSFGKGKGFRTGGIDLGMNSGNVDQSIDGHARSNFESYRDRQSYDGSHNYLSGVQTYQHDESTNRQDHGRRKREEDTTDIDIDKLSKCTTSNCFPIKCVTGPITKGGEVHIALRARVVVQTLKNISMTQEVKIESMVLARISKFQEISGIPAQRTLYKESAVTKVMAPSPDHKPDIVPLWVVILSAVAGTLILLLLIFLLHKCGFFKRNRPSDAPERQPLNRNGHFQHGDEAL